MLVSKIYWQNRLLILIMLPWIFQTDLSTHPYQTTLTETVSSYIQSYSRLSYVPPPQSGPGSQKNVKSIIVSLNFSSSQLARISLAEFDSKFII